MEQWKDLDARAIRARDSEDELNRLARDCNDFILRNASKTCKRFITDSDDEYEIALVAFCEAVRTYNAEAGGFAGFASLVIRRRLMDYFDTQKRRSREIAAGSAMTWDEGEPSGVVAEVQRQLARDDQDQSRTVRDEILAMTAILKEYGFTFFDVAKASPRAEKTKRGCARAVNWMLAVAERILNMRLTRSLPIAALCKALELARKLIERHRRYIIASTEILDGDFPQLAEYLDYIKKERTL